ncbi:hypothetical protein [Micromonospora zamorensis]
MTEVEFATKKAEILSRL